MGNSEYRKAERVVAPKSSWGSKSSMFLPKYFAGHYHAPHTDMIVNRGIGNPMLLPRLFNRPENNGHYIKTQKGDIKKCENQKTPFKTIYTCFPQGKHKVLTMSYDDGKISDRKLIEILNTIRYQGYIPP